jgi:hypothetical protein
MIDAFSASAIVFQHDGKIASKVDFAMHEDFEVNGVAK